MSGFNSKYTGAEVEDFLDGKIAIINHGTGDTTFEMTPNVLHKWGVVTNLVLTFPQDDECTVREYKVTFIASEGFSLSVPLTMRWANDEIPKFEAGKQYEMSVFDKRIMVSAFAAPFIEGEFLQYIENDGVDYIMTDIYMSNKMYGMKYKAAPLFSMGQSKNYAVAGTRQTAGTVEGTSFFMWYLSTQQGRMLYWNGTNKAFGDFTSGQVVEDVLEDVQNLVASDYPLIVFGGNNAGTPDYNSKFRLYYLELLDANSNAIISLRPFKRVADSSIGLLDTISGKFYPSVNGNLVGA